MRISLQMSPFSRTEPMQRGNPSSLIEKIALATITLLGVSLALAALATPPLFFVALPLIGGSLAFAAIRPQVLRWNRGYRSNTASPVYIPASQGNFREIPGLRRNPVYVPPEEPVVFLPQQQPQVVFVRQEQPQVVVVQRHIPSPQRSYVANRPDLRPAISSARIVPGTRIPQPSPPRRPVVPASSSQTFVTPSGHVAAGVRGRR